MILPRIALIMAICLLLIPVSGADSPVLPKISVAFISQAHQIVSPGCFNIQVTLNVTSNLSTAYFIGMQKFYIYESNPSLTVNNQQYWAQSNNTVSPIILFPSNTIQLVINFANFCIISSTGIEVFLLYNDPSTPYTTRIF